MAAKILVTGGSGFIGNAIVRELVSQGKSVKVLIRRTSCLENLQGLTVETSYGDLRDPDSLRRALEGCDTLYHVAAKYSLWNPDPTEIYAVNVEGTRNILSIALQKGVAKVVYTSTVGTLGIFKNGKPGNEDVPEKIENCKGHYKKTKFLAEQVALQFVKKGLPLVIVNPTAPIGERDVKPTPTGRMIADFCRGRMWGYMATGLNLVYVQDVAKGHILACEKGRVGERYILGHRNLTLKEILNSLSELTGIVSPRLNLPYSFVYAAATGSEIISQYFTKTKPFISLEEAQLAKNYMYFDSSKAVRELGFCQTDVTFALQRAVEWFRQKGYV